MHPRCSMWRVPETYAAHGAFPIHGALRILKVILGYDYLWLNVRVKGGAYGCMSGFMRNGDSYFASYRDPNLSDRRMRFTTVLRRTLRSFDADEREMTGYIIGTISDLDIPLNPSAKGSALVECLSDRRWTYADAVRRNVMPSDKRGAGKHPRACGPLIEAVLSDQQSVRDRKRGCGNIERKRRLRYLRA